MRVTPLVLTVAGWLLCCQSEVVNGLGRQENSQIDIVVPQGLLASFRGHWSPSGGRMVACDYSKPGGPPQFFTVGTRRWTTVPMRPLERVMRRPGRDAYRVREALWIDETELAVSVVRFQSSEAASAAYIYRVTEDGEVVQRLCVTLEEAELSLSPDRQQLGVRGPHGRGFSWGRLVERQYWQIVRPASEARDRTVALGSFVLHLRGSSLRAPVAGRTYFWEVGGLDGTPLASRVGRGLWDVHYLPGMKALGFHLSGENDKAAQEGSGPRRIRGDTEFELGTAPVSMRSWSRHKLRMPRDLEGLPPAGLCVWSADGRAVYVRHATERQIWSIELGTGRADVVARDLPGHPIGVLPSPDGRHLGVLVGSRRAYAQPSSLTLIRLPH